MANAPTARVLLGLGAGLLAGLLIAGLAPAPPSPWWRIVDVVEPIGTLWVNAIRMTVLPLIVPLLIVGVVESGNSLSIGRLALRSFGLFLLMLVVTGAVSALIGPWLFGHLVLDPAGTAALRAAAKVTVEPAAPFRFAEWLTSLVPTNPIKAAADGALLPVVLFTLAFAFALTRAGQATRLRLVELARGISEVSLILVRWILALAPVGVFALALALGSRLGTGAVGAIGFYIITCIAVMALTGVALYLVVAAGSRVPLRAFARAALPAQAVAFSSRSSLAALPALIGGARDQLRLSEEVTGFVLPLGVSAFKLTAATYWLFGALLVARLYGIEMSVQQIVTITAASVILNASTPGIPSGGLLIQAPVYASLGLPLEGLGVLIAIDTIPDMVKTAVNVTADLVVAVLLGAPRGGGTTGEETAT